MSAWTAVSVGAAVLGVVLLAYATGQPAAGTPGEGTVALQITGGHETDARDGGRPIDLIASALKVPPETFRKAFSGVTPARNGPPTQEQTRRNKQALMSVLAPLGVTNERLDEVSNYYRYRPQNGELWKHADAAATATLHNGAITKITITSAGSGYSSPPTVTLPGNPARFTATISFTDTLSSNGGIEKITLAPATQPAGGK